MSVIVADDPRRTAFAIRDERSRPAVLAARANAGYHVRAVERREHA
jgi:hypothetical protein